MKVYVDDIEMYPVLILVTDRTTSDELEVPKEFYKRFKRVEKEFSQVQSEILKALKDRKKE